MLQTYKTINTVRTAAIHYPPYLVVNKDNNVSTMHGYCGQLLLTLATSFNLSFNVTETKDGQFGGLENNQTWTGMIGDVVNGTTDIAPCVGMTKLRRDYVLYSPGLHAVQFEVIYRKLDSLEWNYGFYLKPFDKTIWLSIFFIILIVILIKNYSIYSNRRIYYLRSSDCGFTNAFLIWPIILLSNFKVISINSKICLATYLFFSMLMFSSYTSLLTALFAIGHVKIPFRSLQEMVFDSNYIAGILSGNSIKEFFVKSFKNQPFEEVFNLQEGIEAVYKKKLGLLALAMDVMPLINKNCSFSVAPFYFNREIITFAYSKQFPLAEYFNIIILKVKECGILDLLKSRYLPEFQECKIANLYQTAAFGHTVGPFLVLLSGVLLSLMLGILEILKEKLNSIQDEESNEK